MKVSIQTTTEIDTDNFTDAQWREFIIANVSYKEISRTIMIDMFPMSRLKERALICYNASIELCDWAASKEKQSKENTK